MEILCNRVETISTMRCKGTSTSLLLNTIPETFRSVVDRVFFSFKWIKLLADDDAIDELSEYDMLDVLGVNAADCSGNEKSESSRESGLRGTDAS